jgi:hypothetical protein
VMQDPRALVITLPGTKYQIIISEAGRYSGYQRSA